MKNIEKHRKEQKRIEKKSVEIKKAYCRFEQYAFFR